MPCEVKWRDDSTCKNKVESRECSGLGLKWSVFGMTIRRERVLHDYRGLIGPGNCMVGSTKEKQLAAKH